MPIKDKEKRIAYYKKYSKVYREKNKEKIIKVCREWYARMKKDKIKSLAYFADKKRRYNVDGGLLKRYYKIRGRCNNPNHVSYRWYGAKGIIVEWINYKDFKRDMFESYKKHVKKHGYLNTTIDRIDSNKNYCKENCRWATMQLQNANRHKK